MGYIDSAGVGARRHTDGVATASAEDPILETGKRHFGVRYLKPVQRLVISNTLECYQECEERSPYQVVILPTGTGKSLCFQLSALLLPHLTVIVYPLLGLIADQYRTLHRASFGVGVLTGSTPRKERTAILEQARGGALKMLLTNPETLLQPATLSALEGCACDHLVIDEAHCVYEWGASFRPAYQELGGVVASGLFKIVSAFTATASPQILQKISALLFGNERVHTVATDPDRSNISYHLLPTCYHSRLFIEICRSPSENIDQWRAGLPLPRPALVFCRSRVSAEQRAHQLRRALGGSVVRFYHAGLSKEERADIERWFLESTDGILCATCAYGMGMDKPNIRSVLHVEMPSSIESYLQESGRAGRDGEAAVAVVVRPLTPPPHTPQSGALDARGDGESDISRARAAAVENFVFGAERCRRATLTSYLGTTIEQCSGCDMCNGTYRAVPSHSYKIIRWLRLRGRIYTRAELLVRLQGSALCVGWSREQISDMYQGLLEQRIIKVRSKNRGTARVSVPRVLYREIKNLYNSHVPSLSRKKNITDTVN